MSLSTTGPQASKRKPYASRACLECQRRKTKCNEEQPCQSCRARQVECRYCEPEAIRQTPAKRPRLRADQTDLGRPSMDSWSTGSPSGDDSQALREMIHKLRQDVDRLSSDRNSGAMAQNVSAPAQTYYQQPSEFLDTPPNQNVANESRQDLRGRVEQTDTFDPLSGWDSPIAIANKIGAIQNDFATTTVSRRPNTAKSSKTFTLTLPSPQQLKRQLDVFLVGVDDYSPYFRPSALQKRVASALHALSYGETQTTIHITWAHCTTFAILCVILAAAEVFSSHSSTIDLNTGQHWSRQAKWLMEEFEDSIEDSLDVVIYHMVEAGNLMEAERLRPATSHIVRASHAALCIGLNDKTRWKLRPNEIVSRPCLWWSLFFLEKRLAWKCGITYLLRPSEVNVEDSLAETGDPEIECSKLELIESMISYSRLWTSIWQDFFAPNAPLAGKWTEVQLTDAKIMIAYNQLPSRLLWDTDKVDEYLENGATESDLRRRLQVYLRQQSLRLTIRQGRVSSAKGDEERQRSCLVICKDIISAIGTYMKRFVCWRPLGYFLTCCLVECVFHIKHKQSGQPSSTDSRDMLETLQSVRDLLETLSVSVGCGQRALAALRCALSRSEEESEACRDGTLLLPGVAATEGVHALQDPFDERVRAFSGEYFDAFNSDAGLAETLHFLGLVPV